MAQKFNYLQSENVKKAKKKYDEYALATPEGFNYSGQKQLDDLQKKYINPPDFSYKPSSDPLYLQYRDSYTKSAKKAMDNTLSDASSLTGGYSNSYAVSAANQAYNQQMGLLSDRIPELYELAYEKYSDSLKNMRDRLDYLSDTKSDEYGMYRDKLEDYYNELSRLYDEYESEYDRDYREQEDKWSNDFKVDEAERDQLNKEAELAYKNEALENQFIKDSHDFSIAKRELSLKNKEFEASQVPKNIRFSDDELYILLHTSGRYDAMCAIDHNYNGDTELIRLKAITLGIDPDYALSYIKTKQEM